MKKCFAYIRVGYAPQGQHQKLLDDQRAAVSAFAEQNDLKIVRWFKGGTLQAKTGNRILDKMIGLLEQGKAGGAILYKLDSVRNLRQAANLMHLADQGVEIYSVKASLPLNLRIGTYLPPADERPKRSLRPTHQFRHRTS